MKVDLTPQELRALDEFLDRAVPFIENRERTGMIVRNMFNNHTHRFRNAQQKIKDAMMTYNKGLERV